MFLCLIKLKLYCTLAKNQPHNGLIYVDHPRLNLRTTNVMTKNNIIQDNVEMKPKYTSCSSSPHPLVRIHLSAVVACVNGKQYDMYLANSFIVKQKISIRKI